VLALYLQHGDDLWILSPEIKVVSRIVGERLDDFTQRPVLEKLGDVLLGLEF
jgi:hypothetical protein